MTIDIVEYEGRPQHKRIKYLLGSSTSKEIVAQVKNEISERDKVIVILDSSHSESHVYNEIKIYNKFVSKGSYLIVEDTNLTGPMEAVKEFLNSNRGVDFLIAYYYPTYEDMNNNIALCSLILSKDIKNLNITNENFDQEILWNEYYDFLSDSKKAKILSYYNLLNEASEMLQVVEEAYFILYELWMTINYRSLSELDDLHECLERWLIRAEHINKFCWELKPIVDYNFIYLIRYMNNIFYYCCN